MWKNTRKSLTNFFGIYPTNLMESVTISGWQNPTPCYIRYPTTENDHHSMVMQKKIRKENLKKEKRKKEKGKRAL